MPSYQILKHEVIGRHSKWTQAYGLKPRSFLRADGETPVGRDTAINKFLLDSKRCRRNLILVEYPDLGYRSTIIAEVNPVDDVKKIASEIVSGMHASLLDLLKSRWPIHDFEQGTSEEVANRIAQALSESVYPDERSLNIDQLFTGTR